MKGGGILEFSKVLFHFCSCVWSDMELDVPKFLALDGKKGRLLLESVSEMKGCIV